MSALFASGHAVDIVLAVMLAEAAMLVARGRSPVTVVLAFAPGALILLAVRGALVGAGWPWVAAALALSFPVHLLDLRRRGLWPAPAE
jgi:hypothetical protein